MAKVVFVQDQWAEYLGVMYISAVLKQNRHKCELFIERDVNRIIKNLRIIEPDIVAFPTITGMHHWILTTAKRIKEEIEVVTVLGGPHPTYFPQVIENAGIDIICRGEGEYPILDLANAIDKKDEIRNIPNLWIKQNRIVYRNDLRLLIQNLDELPFADREIYFRYRIFQTNPTRIFIATRGCPYNCSYCYNQKLRELYRNKGKYLRNRSVRNVIEEIKQVKTRRELKTVCFMDDTFTHDKNWVFEFLKVYKDEINLPFICLGTADRLNDEKLVQEFKNSRCHGVYFGIESGNEEIRNKILNKKISNEQIIQAAKNLKKYKLKFRAYNMVGLPGETIENVYETVKLNIQIGTDFPFCSIFTPYWGTKLCDYAIEKGLLKKDTHPDDFYQSYYSYSLLKQKDIDEIVNLQRFFQTVVLFPQLLPLVKKLLKLSPNLFFRIWFGIVFFWILVHSERRPFFWTIWFGLRNTSLLFEKKIGKQKQTNFSQIRIMPKILLL